MAIEVYEGQYTGSEIDAAVGEVNTITVLIPSGATSSNKLATASDVSGVAGDVSAIEAMIPSGASSSNQMATASDITGITDLIPSGATVNNKMATASDITGITEKIPSGASSSNKLATASDITGITEKIPSGASSSNKMATASDITNITNLIPAEATTTNKLADKAFVNSSVGTNTANYISDNGNPFTSVADLEAYSGTVTNNDYAFVTGTDTAGNTFYDRYKATVSGSTVTWAKEYRLNNSSFTSTQWSAINSGITSSIIPSTASSSNMLATVADIPSGTGIAGVQINNTDLTPDANDKVNIPMAGGMVLGVIKASTTYGADIASSGGSLTGELCATEVSYANYASTSDSAFIGKGTLDNVLTGMNLDDVSDETWTFTVDDGQGGTTTVTKTIKVGTTPAQVGE